MESIEIKVRQAIKDVIKVSDSDITLDSVLADIGVDSFAAIDLAYTLDEAFNIKISDAEMKQIKTVKDILEIIKSRINSQNAT